MTLTFTGTASGVPVPNRRHASLHIDYCGQGLLLDAGEGVASALVQAGIDSHRIESVYISHTHADHVSGLPMLLQGMHLSGRASALHLFVPPERECWFFDWFHGMFMFPEKWNFPIRLFSWKQHHSAIANLNVEILLNTHLLRISELALEYGIPANACSFVITVPGSKVVVSSDIGTWDEIAGIASDADVVIVDTAHTHIESLFEFAANTACCMICCTHIAPEHEREIPRWREMGERKFDGRIIVAEDGMRLNVEDRRIWM